MKFTQVEIGFCAGKVQVWLGPGKEVVLISFEPTQKVFYGFYTLTESNPISRNLTKLSKGTWITIGKRLKSPGSD